MRENGKRKFLLADASILEGQRGFPIVQGFLAEGATAIAVRTFGSFAFLTVRGPGDHPTALDFEYPLPHEDALVMLDRMCAPWPIRKTRYLIPHGQLVIEIDVFEGKLAGLILAEVEGPLAAADLPPWLGGEITGDPRFDEGALARAEAPPS